MFQGDRALIADIGPFKERGVALISVLLVFALITMIAADILTQNYRDIKKTQHQHDSKQAYYYALAGEQLAKQVLYRDYTGQENNSTAVLNDNLEDSWAQELTGFDINEGEMSVEIIDLQGRFNINNILDVANDSKINAQYDRFRRLLRTLDISERVADLALDWVDTNQNRSAQGAEDDQYLSLQSPYMAANTLFYDNSELLLLDAVEYDTFDQLRDDVTVLPGISLININTATEALLSAIAPTIKQSDVAQIISAQKQGGFATINEWLAQPFAQSLQAIRSDLSVSSEYFEIRIKSIYDGRISLLKTTLYRDSSDGTMRVIKRQSGL